uniref:Uncharacterized protein n=1 Tax=Anguilla anguilla TaxID=7936 RepID=A0A0E9R9I1_ANGAN
MDMSKNYLFLCSLFTFFLVIFYMLRFAYSVLMY